MRMGKFVLVNLALQPPQHHGQLPGVNLGNRIAMPPGFAVAAGVVEPDQAGMDRCYNFE